MKNAFVCLLILLFAHQNYAMENPVKRSHARITKDEGTRGPTKKKYITYNRQTPKTEAFKYKYITYYPDQEEYKIEGELVSDTDPEEYRKIPKETAEKIFYEYAAENERVQKVK